MRAKVTKSNIVLKRQAGRPESSENKPWGDTAVHFLVFGSALGDRVVWQQRRVILDLLKMPIHPRGPSIRRPWYVPAGWIFSLILLQIIVDFIAILIPLGNFLLEKFQKVLIFSLWGK